MSQMSQQTRNTFTTIIRSIQQQGLSYQMFKNVLREYDSFLKEDNHINIQLEEESGKTLFMIIVELNIVDMFYFFLVTYKQYIKFDLRDENGNTVFDYMLFNKINSKIIFWFVIKYKDMFLTAKQAAKYDWLLARNIAIEQSKNR